MVAKAKERGYKDPILWLSILPMWLLLMLWLVILVQWGQRLQKGDPCLHYITHLSIKSLLCVLSSLRSTL